jgi:hypothetical protein
MKKENGNAESFTVSPKAAKSALKRKEPLRKESAELSTYTAIGVSVLFEPAPDSKPESKVMPKSAREKSRTGKTFFSELPCSNRLRKKKKRTRLSVRKIGAAVPRRGQREL